MKKVVFFGSAKPNPNKPMIVITDEESETFWVCDTSEAGWYSCSKVPKERVDRVDNEKLRDFLLQVKDDLEVKAGGEDAWAKFLRERPEIKTIRDLKKAFGIVW